MTDKISGGYYLKARRIQQSDIMNMTPCAREVWDWMLCNANHRTGEVLASYDDVREGLAWYVGWRKQMYTPDQIRKAYESLTKAGRCTTRKSTRKTVVTVVNYLRYQDPNNYAKPAKKPSTISARQPDVGPHDTQTINNNNNYMAQNNAPSTESTQDSKKDDPVARLFYEAIKALDLPTDNNNNVRLKISAIKKEVTDSEELLDYLTYMRDKFASLEVDFKPMMTEALDIYRKRKKVQAARERAGVGYCKPSQKNLSVEGVVAQEQREREQDERDAEMQRQLHARAEAGEFSGTAIA